MMHLSSQAVTIFVIISVNAVNLCELLKEQVINNTSEILMFVHGFNES